MENVVVVGAGECYSKVLAPALQRMENEELSRVIATVDIKPQSEIQDNPFPDVRHIVRGENGKEPLSSRLADLAGQNPVVFLTHPNEFHTPDALDLIYYGDPRIRVVVEKPYSIGLTEVAHMESLLERNPGRIAMAEYYLTMKNAGLMLLAGLVNTDSFYLTESGIIVPDSGIEKASELFGQFRDYVGDVLEVSTDVLEGEGTTGRVDHRGPHLTDTRLGGGMIQDLGIHALTPIIALKDYLGSVDTSFLEGRVRTAVCDEYAQTAREKFKLADKYIGESYAEMDFLTDTGVDVHVAVGKYTPDNKNRRHIRIKGTRGEVEVDLSDCTMYQVVGNRKKPLLRCRKSYYPVVRTALSELGENHAFNISTSGVALDAQTLVLNILGRARYQEVSRYYVGARPESILP